MYKALLATIALLFFPITIQVGGFDAFTTATAFIYMLFAAFLLLVPAPFRNAHFKKILLGLTLIGVASTLSIPGEFYAASFRRFVASTAGLMLFFLIINMHTRLDAKTMGERVEYFLSFVLYLYALQLLIGMAIYFVPEVGSYFSIFTARDVEVIESSVTDTVKRMTSIILPREAVGEIVAVLTPIALYKILAKGNARYYLILAVYFLGVTLSATRSGFLLFFFAVFIYAITVLPMIKLPTWSAFLVVVGISAPILFIQFPTLFEPIMHRLAEFFAVYEKSDSLAVAINRAGVWYYVEVVLLPQLSLWGNGFLTIYDGATLNFHNLYATALHRLGIIGFVMFFYIFYKILRDLLSARRYSRARADKALLYACVTSILVLLINETKYEFIRQASYQQTLWTMLALYYLAAVYVKTKFNDGQEGAAQSSSVRRPKGLLEKYGHRKPEPTGIEIAKMGSNR